MSTRIGPVKLRLQFGPPSMPHDLREIAATHGMEAISARINELHAAGNHVAAETIERELRGAGMGVLVPHASGGRGRADRR
ncbi:hypothetical protein [Nocardia sp. NPDC049149]|uniref:hypothetical protein n=1 Tax=Nocardia sp. NPDC049149 TaxID=3364315 RepID=UPI00371CDF91